MNSEKDSPALTPCLAPRPPAPRDAEMTDAIHNAISRAVHPLLPDPMAMNDLYAAVDRVWKEISPLIHAPADSASAQLAAMREERAKMCARVERGEFSENCPFCLAKTQSPGVPNPMCHLCDLESQDGTLQSQLAAAQSEVGKLGDKLLRWEIEKISTWEANMKEIGDIMDACGAMDNTQIIPSIATLRRERDELLAKLGMDTPWPAELLFKALVIAENKLREDGRDFDGWESIQSAAQVAQSRIDSARAKQGEGQP